MRDRVSKYPGRVEMLPVYGQPNTFDMVRADVPEQEGTPLNKQTFLTDDVAKKYGLGETATPNDVFRELSKLVGADFVNKNVWIVTPYTPATSEVVLGESERVSVLYSEGPSIADAGAWILRATSVDVGEDGTVFIVKGESIYVDIENVAATLRGYFWTWESDSGTIFYTPSNGKTYEETGDDGSSLFIDAQRATGVFHVEKTGTPEVLYGEPGAYPMSGYAETPNAAPFAGYIYLGIGPFKNIPLFAGSGGGGSGETDPSVLAAIADLYARVTALEENGGGSSLPNGDDVLYPESNTFTFYVDGIAYTAKKGMTWAQFIASEYNPDFECDCGCGYMYETFSEQSGSLDRVGVGIWWDDGPGSSVYRTESSDGFVTPSDTIMEEYSYFAFEGSPGEYIFVSGYYCDSCGAGPYFIEDGYAEEDACPECGSGTLWWRD